ncbi:MAG: hypothetical protein MR817_05555 [Lachnospiraceae bacterium]|nr:hypothetical protein [Lachnospiraceae bacterium]
MKKNLLVIMLVGAVLTVGAATGCGASAPDAEIGVNTETGTNTEESEAVVKPLYPLETAQDALADGGYSVSFTADDLIKTDGGYELTVEVYEYDRYEMEAIDNLESGSKIQFCNKEITVDKVEKETGYIQINGGIENDGIELMGEDGLYRTVTVDDYPVYYSVGKVTIPLSDDVTFEDQAGSEQESDLPIVELKDLPDAIENSDISFGCNNTVITVRQEQIVQIIRHWVP